MDVSSILPYRKTKYCVCVSAGKNKCFLINSEHREMYDDFKISALNYSFLENDSYVGCSEAFELKEELIIKKCGVIDYNDMVKILDKVKKSEHLDEAVIEIIVQEFERWLKQESYAENKLKNKFNKR
ncbi:MAG: hypothetical protein FWC26_02580 [Fibromonadales bacterium]|nr:hypothetical protein [Fibromonadales bacterium]